MLGRIMLAVGGLVVAALFAALLVPFFVDWSSFRVAFEDQASRLLGKKVSVHGSVDARILPFPSVTLHDVRIGQDVDGQPLMQAVQFSMDMELAPFLSGEARIFDMRIEQPQVKVRILKDGTLEWLRGSRAAIEGRKVVIEDVHVRDGRIDIIDDRNGQVRHVTGFTAEMSADSLRGPWRGEGNASLDGNEAKFTLTSGEAAEDGHEIPLRLKLLPDAQPVQVDFDGSLSVADNRPVYDGKFNLAFLSEEDETEPVNAPSPGPRVSGDFELTGERARIPQYRLEVGPTDSPYVVTGEATLDTGPKPEFLLTADGQQIDVNRLTDGAGGAGGGARGKTGRDPSASAQRRINAFIRMAASIPIPQVPGHASVKLPAIVINDTTIRDIKLDVRPAGRGWAVDNVVAVLPGRTQLEAKGMLNLADRTAFAGTMLVASNQPSGLADWLSGRVDPAIRQMKSAGFSARVNLTPEQQRFDDLELAIGPATLKGQLERQSLPRQMPNLSMTLAGNEIDIDAMRALASLVTGGDAGQEMLDHRVSASLKADRFTAFGVAATKVDTAFTMAQGVLSLERLTVGDVEGASISAKGRIEGSLLSYGGSGSVSFKAADPTRFLAMLRDRLTHHPLLDRLARNAGWYANSDLTANIAVGGGGIGGAEVKVSGSANGSAVSADLSLPGIFDLTGGDEMRLAASLANPQASVILGQAGLDPLPFEGDGAARLELSVNQPAISVAPGLPLATLRPAPDGASGSGQASAPSSEGARTGLAQTRLSFSTPKTTLTANGAVDLGEANFGNGRAHLTLKSADVEPYLLLLGIGLPQFGNGLPATVDGDLEISPDRLQLSAIQARLAENSVSGSLQMARSAPGQPVTGSLKAGTADLAWLAESVFGPLADPSTGAASAKPLGAPMFGGADIALDVALGTLHAPQLGAVTDFTGKLVQRSGGLTIDAARGTWHGGQLSGRLMMSSGQGTGIVQARLTAEGADLGSVVWPAAGRPVADGKLGFDVNAEATGKSMAELLHGLGGSGQIRLSGLRLNGLNAQALPQIMAAADKLQGGIAEDRVRPTVIAATAAGTTQIGSISIPLTIAGGEARLQDVGAVSGATTLSGQGQFDPIDNRIAANLSVTYNAGEEAVEGGDPTVRFDYSGRLDRPDTRVDLAAMANFLSMRAYEQERRRVETLQASVLEKQRLRREVALYTFAAGERAAARQKAEAEERARLAAEEAERQKAEAARKADEARQNANTGNAGGGSGNAGTGNTGAGNSGNGSAGPGNASGAGDTPSPRQPQPFAVPDFGKPVGPSAPSLQGNPSLPGVQP